MFSTLTTQALDEVKDFGEHVLSISWHGDGAAGDMAADADADSDTNAPSGGESAAHAKTKGDDADAEQKEIDELIATTELDDDFDGELDFSEAIGEGKILQILGAACVRSPIQGGDLVLGLRRYADCSFRITVGYLLLCCWRITYCVVFSCLLHAPPALCR